MTLDDTGWYDDQYAGWMLAVEPILAKVRLGTESSLLSSTTRAYEVAFAKLVEDRDRVLEECVEARCRLDARRQMMEHAVAGLSADLDVAHQVTAALVAERVELEAGLRAATLTLDGIVQAGILYDPEWLTAARDAVAAARRLAG